MKKRSLITLLIPLCALSGCSYRGEAKPLRDGNLLLSESSTPREDTFEVVDQHIKAKDTFCIYFSLEGCSACERFTEGFKEVVQENKILTFHLEAPNKADDMLKLYEAYPDFKTSYSPSFFLVNEQKIEEIPYEQINSESRLRNTLKRKVSLIDRYYFEGENIDFTTALNKAGLSEVTLIELDFAVANQVDIYYAYRLEYDEPMFIHQKTGLEQIQISKIFK